MRTGTSGAAPSCTTGSGRPSMGMPGRGPARSRCRCRPIRRTSPVSCGLKPTGRTRSITNGNRPTSDGGAPVTGYRLLWCRVLDGADDNPCDVTPDEDNPLADPPGYSRIALGASARSYNQSVSPGYVYYYLLRATNGGNRWSEWVYVFTVTVYPGLPAAPGLTARAVDANQIKVTWTRPNSYGAEIGEYWLYIYRYGENLHDFSDNIIDILRIPGDQTEYTLGGLDPETTRYFRVRALNDNGEGKYSALRHATTPASTQSQSQARNDAVLPNSRPQRQQRGRVLRAAYGHGARRQRQKVAAGY